MSRAALLSYPGDPFLLNYWLKFFDEVWGDEVDHLYIHLNSPIEIPVVQYIRSLCDARPKITLLYDVYQTDHGPSILKLLRACKEEFVMLIEDDGFIFKKGAVAKAFSYLETGGYDLVGSSRGSCSQEIWDAAAQRWGLDYSGEGDNGPNFWPNFLFTRRSTLMKTDLNFSAKQWKKGEIIEGLAHRVQEEVAHGDTLVSTSLQLRGMLEPNRILCIPQYHGSPDDIEHHTRGKFLFDGKAPWTHVGSLSSGVGGILMDDYNRSLSRRLIDPEKGATVLPDICHTDQERNEFERRVQWWLRFHQYYLESVSISTSIQEINDFADLYQLAIERIILQYGLSRSNIRQRQNIYKTLGL